MPLLYEPGGIRRGRRADLFVLLIVVRIAQIFAARFTPWPAAARLTWINGMPGRLRKVVRVDRCCDLAATGRGKSFTGGEGYDDNGRQAGRDGEGGTDR